MRLVDWRKSKKLKLEDVAPKLEVTPSQLSKIERGETFTSPKTAQKILAITEGAVTPNDLHDTWREYEAERGAA